MTMLDFVEADVGSLHVVEEVLQACRHADDQLAAGFLGPSR